MADEPVEKQEKGFRPSARLVGAAVICVALVVFIVQNDEETHVEWLFFETTQPLWMILIVTIAAAALASQLASASLRRGRRKAAKRG